MEYISLAQAFLQKSRSIKNVIHFEMSSNRTLFQKHVKHIPQSFIERKTAKDKLLRRNRIRKIAFPT